MYTIVILYGTTITRTLSLLYLDLLELLCLVEKNMEYRDKIKRLWKRYET